MIPIPGARLPTSGTLSYLFYRGVINGEPHYHRGVDLAAPLGTPVQAAEGGTVAHAVRDYTPGFRGYGRAVVIRSNSRRPIYYLYAHLDSVLVTPGQAVRTGDVIGTVGYTALTSAEPEGLYLSNRAPHLHFEVSGNPYPQPSEANRLDPIAVLRGLLAPPVAPGGGAPRGGGGGGFALLALALLWLSRNS